MLLTTDGKTMPAYSANFQHYFQQISRALGSARLSAAEQHVDGLINSQKQDEVHVASWLPGKDWGGSDLQPIYDECVRLYPNGDPHEFSARFFGQLVRSRFAAHPETWYCTLNEYVARSWIYFRKR